MHAAERETCRRFGEQHVFGSGSFSESATGGDVIGVKMSVDDIANAHPRRFGGLEVRGKVTKRIDYGSRCAAAAAEQIRSRDGIGVKKLT